MKIRLLLLVLLSVGAFGLRAQQVIRETAVPPEVREEFVSRFADVEGLIWLKQGDDFYGARFKIKDQSYEAIYAPNGDWVQTEQQIAYLDMPDEARSYCRAHYPDYQSKSVKKVSTRRYGILYEIKIADNLQQVAMTFDMHGKLIEEAESDLAEVQAEENANSSVKDKLGKLWKKKEVGE
jgi:hypothetical protein